MSQASSTGSTRKGLDCDKSLSYPNRPEKHTRSALSWRRVCVCQSGLVRKVMRIGNV